MNDQELIQVLPAEEKQSPEFVDLATCSAS